MKLPTRQSLTPQRLLMVSVVVALVTIELLPSDVEAHFDDRKDLM